jgi:beta-N-acetylhexosaminidase
LSNKGFAAGTENALPAIFSLSGTSLTPSEKSFFKECNPLGFILFARNCENPAQVKALNEDLKEALGRNCPILIDQEGGRVQRLKPPLWRAYPPMRAFGEIAETNMDKALEDLRFTILQMGEELHDNGFNVDCAPVLDILTEDTHDVIGDRGFSADPEIVARLGLSVCRNLLAADITPIIKHIPGHGRGKADSHLELPTVATPRAELEALDFKPFKMLAASDVAPAVWGMTAHILYTDLDKGLPASLSPKIINEVIREHIGFEGLLIADDPDMKALAAYGDSAQCCRKALEAGCDLVFSCFGVLKDMENIAKSVPKLTERARKCLQKAEEFRKLAA